MTANLLITSLKKSDAIAIPMGAILSKDGKKLVKLKLSDGKIIDQVIGVGEIGALGQTEVLAGILDDVIQEGQSAMIYSSQYLAAFGIREFSTAKDVWLSVLKKLLNGGHPALEKWKPELDIILHEGTLSNRILRELDGDSSTEAITKVYKKLAWCLGQNRMFVPN
jgi:hypothetical protein